MNGLDAFLSVRSADDLRPPSLESHRLCGEWHVVSAGIAAKNGHRLGAGGGERFNR